mmetsp:Transcript_5259/g.13360  ORF Transcript_5259/g.13360 Transcript_5259/m.13360 type:complete len:291 (-) Transcript_5259:143-1015(-)
MCCTTMRDLRMASVNAHQRAMLRSSLIRPSLRVTCSILVRMRASSCWCRNHRHTTFFFSLFWNRRTSSRSIVSCDSRSRTTCPHCTSSCRIRRASNHSTRRSVTISIFSRLVTLSLGSTSVPSAMHSWICPVSSLTTMLEREVEHINSSASMSSSSCAASPCCAVSGASSHSMSSLPPLLISLRVAVGGVGGCARCCCPCTCRGESCPRGGPSLAAGVAPPTSRHARGEVMGRAPSATSFRKAICWRSACTSSSSRSQYPARYASRSCLPQGGSEAGSNSAMLPALPPPR